MAARSNYRYMPELGERGVFEMIAQRRFGVLANVGLVICELNEGK